MKYIFLERDLFNQRDVVPSKIRWFLCTWKMYLYTCMYINLENVQFSWKECPRFTYGKGCFQRCGNCANGATCDHVTGTCPEGCMPGYTGNKCDKGQITVFWFKIHCITIFINSRSHNGIFFSIVHFLFLYFSLWDWFLWRQLSITV